MIWLRAAVWGTLVFSLVVVLLLLPCRAVFGLSFGWALTNCWWFVLVVCVDGLCDCAVLLICLAVVDVWGGLTVLWVGVWFTVRLGFGFCVV